MRIRLKLSTQQCRIPSGACAASMKPTARRSLSIKSAVRPVGRTPLARARKQRVVRRLRISLHPLAVPQHHGNASRLPCFDKRAHAFGGVDVVLRVADAFLGEVALGLLAVAAPLRHEEHGLRPVRLAGVGEPLPHALHQLLPVAERRIRKRTRRQILKDEGLVDLAVGGRPLAVGHLAVGSDRAVHRVSVDGRGCERAGEDNEALHPVPPTVSPSIRSVGCPTPTGTLCPSLPQVPTPESSSRSLPTMLTRVSTSGPFPISVAPFTG